MFCNSSPVEFFSLFAIFFGSFPWKPGFDPRLVHVECVMDKVALDVLFFFPISSVFPCQCRATNPPLSFRRYAKLVIIRVGK